jgi:hypothetical protein
MAIAIERVRLGSWRSLKERLRDEEGWIYRGQLSSKWNLATSLERAIAKDAHAPSTESNLIHQFQTQARNYIPPGQLPVRRIEWLARMQHHGVPTRLLDFTFSPYVAAYFAIEDAEVPTETEPAAHAAAIWAIGTSWALLSAGERLGQPLTGDFAADFGGAFARVRNWYRTLKQTSAEFDGVAPVVTERRSEREAVQQALFVAPGNLVKPFAVNLETMTGLEQNVRCFELPYSWRAEVLTDLRKMNITRASLFPGLDGFAQSLRYDLITEPSHARKMRVAKRDTEALMIATWGVAQALKPPDPM